MGPDPLGHSSPEQLSDFFMSPRKGRWEFGELPTCFHVLRLFCAGMLADKWIKMLCKEWFVCLIDSFPHRDLTILRGEYRKHFSELLSSKFSHSCPRPPLFVCVCCCCCLIFEGVGESWGNDGRVSNRVFRKSGGGGRLFILQAWGKRWNFRRTCGNVQVLQKDLLKIGTEKSFT